jgi:hypothetical protein
MTRGFHLSVAAGAGETGDGLVAVDGLSCGAERADNA